MTTKQHREGAMVTCSESRHAVLASIYYTMHSCI